MALLGREEILSAEDDQYEDVAVPEWGGTVRVKGLTGQQRDAYEASAYDKDGNKTPKTLVGLRAKLVAMVIVDEHDLQIFTEKDIPGLGKKSARALERVFQAGLKVSGMSADDVEALAENFGDDQSEPSTSD